MANEPSVALGEIPQTGDLQEVEALVLRRAHLVEQRKRADRSLAKAKETHTRRVKPINTEQSALDERLAALVMRRKRGLLNRFGHVIKLPGGVIRHRVDAPSLDTPRVTTAIIRALEAIRGGGKYLVYKASLDRDALTQAPPSLLRLLRPLGVWVGRHEIVTIKSTGEEEPTNLVRRRYKTPKR